MELNRINFSGVVSRLTQLTLDGQKVLADSQKDPGNKYNHQLSILAQETVESIKESLREAQMLRLVCEVIKKNEIQLETMISQIHMLTNENNWLREELLQTRVKLGQIETQLIEQNSKINHLEFVQSNDLMVCGDMKSNEESSILTKDLAPTLSCSIDTSTKSNYDTPQLDFNMMNISKDDDNVEANLLPLAASPKEKNLFANNPRLKTIHDLVLQALNECKYEVAIPLCKEAMEEAEKNNGTRIHEEVAAILNLLAVVYKEQENYGEACQVLDECLRIREKIYGEDHPIVASSLNNLAVLYGKKRQFVQAEILCRRALSIRNNAFGSSHPDVAKQLLNLAILNQNQAKYSEAEKLYKKSLEVYNNNFGPSSSHVLKLYHRIKSEAILKKLVLHAYEEFSKLIQSKKSPSHNPNDDQPHNRTYPSETNNKQFLRQKRLSNCDELDSYNKVSKYEEFGEWHKATSEMSSPSLWAILKSLLLLYKKSNNTENSYSVSNVLKNLQKPSFHNDLFLLLKKLNIIN